MKSNAVRNALEEAERFIRQAEKVLDLPAHSGILESGRETAALRRRSMDLTRALADLRKP